MKDVVLVTGAGGFVGRQLRARLKQAGFHIRALYHHKPVAEADSFSMDLARDDFDRGLLDGVDTIFHLAGKAHSVAESVAEIADYQRVNTLGTHRLLEAAMRTGVKRFIFFSSVKAVGESDQQPMDESCAVPANTPYGQSKYAAEQLVLFGGYVPHPVVIRPSMIYGNTQKGNLPRMIKAVRRGVFPPLPEMHNKRSMVHVDDVVEAALLSAQKPQAAGQVYIVTDDTPYSSRQIYDLIRVVLDRPPLAWQLPLWVLQAFAKTGNLISSLTGKRFPFDSAALQKLTDSACYSSAKIRRELGFVARNSLPSCLPDIVRFLNIK